MDSPLIEQFFRKRMVLIRSAVFILNCTLGVDVLYTSDLLCPNMELRLQLVSTRPNIL